VSCFDSANSNCQETFKDSFKSPAFRIGALLYYSLWSLEVSDRFKPERDLSGTTSLVDRPAGPTGQAAAAGRLRPSVCLAAARRSAPGLSAGSGKRLSSGLSFVGDHRLGSALLVCGPASSDYARSLHKEHILW